MAEIENKEDKPNPATFGRQKKKDTRNKDKARSMFNPDAPLIPLEKCFAGFTTNKRANAEVELDLTVVDRVDEFYLRQVKLHNRHNRYDEITSNDNRTDFKLLNRCALFKKLMMTMPQSKIAEVQKYQSISQAQLMVPPALAVIYDSIGKTEESDLNIRIKNDTYVLHSVGLGIAREYTSHSDNDFRYSDDEKQTIRACIPGQVHYGDEASTIALRDLASKYLDELYNRDFQLTLRRGAVVSVAYPRIEKGRTYNDKVNAFIRWIAKLDATFENVQEAVYCGLLSIARTEWFSDENIDTRIGTLVPAIGANDFETTPRGILDLVEWSRLEYDESTRTSLYMRILMQAFSHVAESTATNMSRVFHLKLQPHNTFGNVAQLIVTDNNCFAPQRSQHQAGVEYSEIEDSAVGRSLTKLTDNTNIAIALMMGISRDVKYSSIYEGRLTENNKSLRARFLSSDFRPIV